MYFLGNSSAILGNLLSSALGFGGSMLGNSINFDQQLALQKNQQAWQERMSNTAHQREVKDLRLAGLNPLLSATGGSGASVSGGSSPSISAPVFGKMDLFSNLGRNDLHKLQSFSNASESVADRRKKSAEADYLKQQTRRLKLENDFYDKYPQTRTGVWNRSFNSIQDLIDKGVDFLFNGVPLPADGEWKLDKLPKPKYINLPDWKRIQEAPYKLRNKYIKK